MNRRGMARLLTVLLVFALAIGGAAAESNQRWSVGSPDAEPTPGAGKWSVGTPGAEPTPDAGKWSVGTQSPADASGGAGVLLDEGGVRLEVTSVEFRDTSNPYLRFDVWVENRTGREINIMFDQCYADGVEVDGIGIYELADGSSMPEYFFFGPLMGQSAEILRSPGTLSFRMRVVDDNTYAEVLTRRFELTNPAGGASAPSVVQPTEQASGNISDGAGMLLDEGGVRLEVTSVEFRDTSDPYLRFDVWVENRTGKEINIMFDQCYADGVEVKGIGIYDLADGASMAEYFFFKPLENQSAEILRSPGVLSFEMLVVDDDTFDTLFARQFRLVAPADGSPAAPQQPAQRSGSYSPSGMGTLLDQNGVRLEVTSIEFRESAEPYLRFGVWASNNSGKTVNITFDNAYADVFEVRGIGIYTLAHGASIEEFFFFKALEGQSPEVLRNPRALAFTLHVEDDATYQQMFSLDYALTGPFTDSSQPQAAPRATQTPAVSYPWLEKGSRGEDVRKLQLGLISLGYLRGSADGVYGQQTAQAVYDFREANGLLIGIYDNEASPTVQEVLYSGNAVRYTEPAFALEIFSGANAQWESLGNDRLKIRAQVRNSSRTRTVKAFEMYMYATDVWGERIYGADQVYYGTTTKTVSPGKTVYCDYMYVPDRSKIDKVYFGIKKIIYTDGSVEEASSVEYWNWSIY